MQVREHIGFAWGENIDSFSSKFDVIIGNDLMIYVKQHQNQVKTISEFLFRNPVGNRVFLSWGRKPSKEDQKLYFEMLEKAGLSFEHLGHRILRIKVKLL